jgi:predicted esterase
MGNLCADLFGSPPSEDEAEALILEPEKCHSASLIFLHGLGDTGAGWRDGFAGVGSELRIILPTAPCMPVTLNGGARMPSWFDIRGLTPDAPQDEQGIAAAASRLRLLVEQEMADGIPPSKIFVGGFSQGGAVALHLAYTEGFAGRLGGVLGLSTWLPLAHISSPQPHEPLEHLPPALLCHGGADRMVPLAFGKATAQLLRGRGIDVAFSEYPGMAHSSCSAEMREVRRFLEAAMGGSSPQAAENVE